MSMTPPMTPPKMPPRPQKTPAQPSPPVYHPAVSEYVAEWNKMAHELDKLRAENQRLQYELDVANNMIKELQHISDHERAKKETYQRWASRFDTLTGEIAGLATQLRDEARQAATPEPEKEQIESFDADKMEDEIATIAKKFAHKIDGGAP